MEPGHISSIMTDIRVLENSSPAASSTLRDSCMLSPCPASRAEESRARLEATPATRAPSKDHGRQLVQVSMAQRPGLHTSAVVLTVHEPLARFHTEWHGMWSHTLQHPCSTVNGQCLMYSAVSCMKPRPAVADRRHRLEYVQQARQKHRSSDM